MLKLISLPVASSFVLLLGSMGCMGLLSSGPFGLKKDSYRVVEKDGKRVLEVELTQDAIIANTFPLCAKSRLRSDRYGKLQRIKTACALKVKTLSIAPGATVYVKDFNKNQFKGSDYRVTALRLAAAAKIGELSFLKGDTVRFKDGRPNSARLKGAHDFHGKTIGDGYDVWFNMVGEVTRSRSPGARKAEEKRLARIILECRARCASFPGDRGVYCFRRCTGGHR